MSNDNDGITKVQVKASGVVYAKSGTNTRLPYPHQLDAMENLDKIDDKFPSYSTLVVLPTGGGKTYTATIWLLKRAINRGKKILWIAHRKELLDQAAETFQAHAYADYLTKVASFRYRIVSGDREHDRTRTICKTDNVLFASKDSIGKNLDALKKWFGSEEELYLVIDEAHHATAKTYRTIIDLVKKRIKRSKIIGLTATPFRTAESEQGLLCRLGMGRPTIFSWGKSSVRNNVPTRRNRQRYRPQGKHTPHSRRKFCEMRRTVLVSCHKSRNRRFDFRGYGRVGRSVVRIGFLIRRRNHAEGEGYCHNRSDETD